MPAQQAAPPPPAQSLDLAAFQNAQAASLGIPALRTPAGRRRRLSDAPAQQESAVSSCGSTCHPVYPVQGLGMTMSNAKT